MNDETYSLRQVVDIISVWMPDDERPKLMRRVRHWTSHDLLTPIGNKNSGTGNERRYTRMEVYKAAIVNELSNYGMTVHMLEDFGEWLDYHASMVGKWDRAIKGDIDVYVEVSQTRDGGSAWSMYLAGERAPLAFIAPGAKPIRSIKIKEIPIESAPFTSALTVNITRLFSELKF